MPYIEQERRKALIIPQILDMRVSGELNYVLTSIIRSYLLQHGSRRGISYALLNDVIGVLSCITQELYRRVVEPYEDAKIAINGDVYKGIL